MKRSVSGPGLVFVIMIATIALIIFVQVLHHHSPWKYPTQMLFQVWFVFLFLNQHLKKMLQVARVDGKLQEISLLCTLIKMVYIKISYESMSYLQFF